MEKLEPMDVVPHASPKTALRSLLAQVRWPVSHSFSQLAHAVSQTAQKLEDEWSVEDEKDLSKLVVKLKAFQTLCSVLARRD